MHRLVSIAVFFIDKEVGLASLVPEPNTNNERKIIELITNESGDHGDHRNSGEDNPSIDEPSASGLPVAREDGAGNETSGSKKEDL